MSNPQTTREVQGVVLHLSAADTTEQEWIGQDEILKQLLACWLALDPSDPPLTLRRADERGRTDFRGVRLHPEPSPADADARLPQSRRRDGNPALSSAVRRDGIAGVDGRVSATGARPETRLFAARWDHSLEI